MSEQSAKTKKIFDGRYEILSIVGRGARSVVYHARHVASTTEVALKVLIDQKGKNPSAERLRREALAMVSCRHRYVIRLDDFHSVGSLCYLSMEFAPESDLRNYIKKIGGVLPIEQAERFLKQTAEGLAFIHRAGIIHRDIKPENVLVMNPKEIRITDFGVSLLPGEECTIADLQSGVGTMNYMAPEILEGSAADQRSDLYALGVVFYEMLTGKNPFENAPLARQIDVRKSEQFSSVSKLNPEVPEYLSKIILKCMHYDPDRRFLTGDELLTELLNKRSENFSEAQRGPRKKLSRPKTNNLHKRPRKLQRKKTKESKDIFDDFDALLADEVPLTSKAAPEAQSGAQGVSVEETIVSDNAASALEAPEQGSVEASLSENESIMLEPTPVEEESKPKALRSRPAVPQKTEKERHTFIIFAVSILLLLGVFLPGLRDSVTGAIGRSISALAFWRKSGLELPAFTKSDLSFPELPTGVYSGQMKGLVPGRVVPLTLISFANEDKLVVIVGLEGWRPVIISPSEQAQRNASNNSKSLKVASSGISLDLSGGVMNGRIYGYFSNVVNGAEGEWSVEPAI